MILGMFHDYLLRYKMIQTYKRSPFMLWSKLGLFDKKKTRSEWDDIYPLVNKQFDPGRFVGVGRLVCFH